MRFTLSKWSSFMAVIIMPILVVLCVLLLPYAQNIPTISKFLAPFFQVGNPMLGYLFFVFLAIIVVLFIVVLVDFVRKKEVKSFPELKVVKKELGITELIESNKQLSKNVEKLVNEIRVNRNRKKGNNS